MQILYKILQVKVKRSEKEINCFEHQSFYIYFYNID